jgi:threonine dehydrogenase-like Zn-dependent dehydrogenase
MRAAVLRAGEIVVRDDVPEPVPAAGEVLVQVRACGVCGSDLHFARHGASMVALGEEMEGAGAIGTGAGVDLGRDVFMGHEFSAEVLEAGPGTAAPAPGTIVTSIPTLLTPTGIREIVYSNDVACGYGERMVLSVPLLVTVPDGLDPGHAALTEPMAVGIHAVNRGGIEPGEGALVLGCGPVGLAVVAALRARGIDTIVASDYSPARRQLALAMGAHEAVDPAREPAFDAWRGTAGEEQVVVFEVVGVPGVIDSIFRAAPRGARIVVVGVCMERDTVTPLFASAKELSLRYVFGYDLNEFAASLDAIAQGTIDVAPLITGRVDLDGVPGAFDALSHPDRHGKILVTP